MSALGLATTRGFDSDILTAHQRSDFEHDDLLAKERGLAWRAPTR